MCFLRMAAGRLAPWPRPEPLPGHLSSPVRRCLCVCERGEGEERRAEAEGLEPGDTADSVEAAGPGEGGSGTKSVTQQNGVRYHQRSGWRRAGTADN